MKQAAQFSLIFLLGVMVVFAWSSLFVGESDRIKDEVLMRAKFMQYQQEYKNLDIAGR